MRSSFVRVNVFQKIESDYITKINKYIGYAMKIDRRGVYHKRRAVV
jgi:hypothetical protein